MITLFDSEDRSVGRNRKKGGEEKGRARGHRLRVAAALLKLTFVPSEVSTLEKKRKKRRGREGRRRGRRPGAPRICALKEKKKERRRKSDHTFGTLKEEKKKKKSQKKANCGACPHFTGGGYKQEK